MTLFSTSGYVLAFLLCAGLTVAWKKENLIRVSGLVGGVLLVELCRYLYISEQTLNIGVDTIVSLGLVKCISFSVYLMICFIILMVTYNHFSIFLGKNSGRTKIIINQFSICVLFLCFLLLTVASLIIGGGTIQQIAGVTSSLADLCIFVMIACCELYLIVDGATLNID